MDRTIKQIIKEELILRCHHFIYFRVYRGLYKLFAGSGLMGRYRQASFYLFGKFYLLRRKESNSTYQEWNREIKEIDNSYAGVRVWMNGVGHRIGEYLARYLILMRFIEENQDGYLNIMFDYDYSMGGNKALSKIIGRNFPVVNTDNKTKWIYILSKVRKVDYSNYYALDNRYDDSRIYYSEWCKDKLSLTDSEIQYCKKKMGEMLLDEPYVCFFNRDRAFLVPPKGNVQHDYRDSKIETRHQLIDYLNDKGIQTVRVGKVACERCNYGNCIDYTFDYRDELMDVYLHSKAKFVVGDSCGLSMIPLMNNGHYVCTNLPQVLGGWCAMPSVFDGIVILKKVFDSSKDRFLTLEEMVEADRKAHFDGNIYRKMGLKHIENTAQEILDAAIEMNERIDGIWTESESDKLRQKKFNDFQQRMAKKYGYPEGDYFHARVGARFLEQNWEIFGL